MVSYTDMSAVIAVRAYEEEQWLAGAQVTNADDICVTCGSSGMGRKMDHTPPVSQRGEDRFLVQTPTMSCIYKF